MNHHESTNEAGNDTIYTHRGTKRTLVHILDMIRDHARGCHFRLPAKQLNWGGSQHLAISAGGCSFTPLTWAVCELHAKRHPTALLTEIVLRIATQ